MNLASTVTESAERSPEGPAIRLGDAELIFAGGARVSARPPVCRPHLMPVSATALTMSSQSRRR